MGKDHLWVWQLATPTIMRGPETVVHERDRIGANKMSELQSYEVETVVRGYLVYGADWEAPVGH